MKKLVSVLLCLASVVGLCACDNKEYDTLEITSMNTVMQITVFNNSEVNSDQVFSLLTDEINRLDALWDVNDSGSDISRVNSAPQGVSVSVDGDTAAMLSDALEAFVYTEGLFDVRLQSIISLWGFDNGMYGVPDNSEIKNLLSQMKDSSFSVDEAKGSVVKNGESDLSVGGIAKGYLGDTLLAVAKAQSTSAVISLGGNIVLCGEKPDGSLWNVGIKNPVDTQELACTFESEGNCSVVTSGAYERYFEYGGETYHHIIDPETGYPADSDLLSVTVVGTRGVVCDCLSTALFVAGKEKAIDLIKEFNDYEFIFITDDNEILYTDGIKNLSASVEDFSVREIQR